MWETLTNSLLTGTTCHKTEGTHLFHLEDFQLNEFDFTVLLSGHLITIHELNLCELITIMITCKIVLAYVCLKNMGCLVIIMQNVVCKIKGDF